MNWHIAFDRTLKEFGISAKWLSQKTGISQQSISKFRNGHCPMNTDNLQALLSQLPFEAKERFFTLLLGASLPSQYIPPIEDQIQRLSKEKKKKIVIGIVESLVGESSSIERVKVAH